MNQQEATILTLKERLHRIGTMMTDVEIAAQSEYIKQVCRDASVAMSQTKLLAENNELRAARDQYAGWNEQASKLIAVLEVKCELLEKRIAEMVVHNAEAKDVEERFAEMEKRNENPHS